MPTYEYRCNTCHREFEYQQRMTDPDLVRCEACNTDTLQRLISWTSVRSDTWKAALFTDNPKQALKGTAAVDTGRLQRFTGNPEPAAATVAMASTPVDLAPAATAAATSETSSDK